MKENDMRRGLAILVILAMSLTACGGDAESPSGQQQTEQPKTTTTTEVPAPETTTAVLLATWYQLQVGTCIDFMPTDGLYRIMDCEEPHDAELFARSEYASSDDTYLPGELSNVAVSTCKAAFEQYVGVSVGDSIYSLYAGFPTEAEWLSGERTIMCLAEYHDGREYLKMFEPIFQTYR